MNSSGYDIVGDIHGHADALKRLLARLGYANYGKGYAHPTRRMVFVGDFIDRGPQQAEVLSIVRGMCSSEAALAVMGNHEFNAIGWATRDANGNHLRPHTEKNTHQHSEFLAQFGEGSTAYSEAINWFRGLPVYLDLNGIRVVHACWHPPSIDSLRVHLDGAGRFTTDGFLAANVKGSPAATAADIVLKGPELLLPNDLSFVDKDGHRRREVRLKWWNNKATTFRSAAIGMENDPSVVPDTPIPSGYTYNLPTPVFFGHYWLHGAPTLTSTSAACLDFSVARAGFLAAYRWSGEVDLCSDNLAYVPTTE